MTYNDFPILNDETYKLMNEYFSHQEPFNRKLIITNICNELNYVLNVCLDIKKQHNHKINNCLNDILNTISKNLNNLSSLFNVSISSKQSFLKLNIFAFFKKLTHILSLLTTWINSEDKQYYKSIAIKTSTEIHNKLTELFSAFEESNYYFFKHM